MDLDHGRRRERLEAALGRAWEPMTLAGRFDALAARHSRTRPYVITDTRSWSYRQLQDWSRDLARGLHANGVRAGDRVALVLDNRPEFVAVKLAIARLGATAVPINFQYRAEELAAVLSVAPGIGPDQHRRRDRQRPAGGAGRAAARLGPRGDASRLPSLRRVFLTDNAARPAAADLRTRSGKAKPSTPTRCCAWSTGSIRAQPATSCSPPGTSGALGAVLSHDMVLRSAYGSAYHRAFDDGWRVCFSLPMYHVFGYVEGLLAACSSAARSFRTPVFNPRSILTAMQLTGSTRCCSCPTMSVAVVEEAADTATTCPACSR